MSRFITFLFITLISLPIQWAYAVTQTSYPTANSNFSLLATNANMSNGLASDISSASYIKLTSSSINSSATSISFADAKSVTGNSYWTTQNAAYAIALNVSSLIDTGLRDGLNIIYQVPSVPFLGFTLGTTMSSSNSQRWVDTDKLTTSSLGTTFCSAYGQKSVDDSSVINCNYTVTNTNSLTLAMANNLYFLPANFTDQSQLNFSTPKTYSGSVSIPAVAGVAIYNFLSPQNYNVKSLISFTYNFNFSVNIIPKFCELDTSDMNQTVDMGAISTTALDNGDIQRGPAINFNFTCPSYANVDIHMEVSDVNDSSNTSNTLKLASIDNSASGVGIKLKDQSANAYINFTNGVAASSQPIVKSVTSLGTTGSQRATYTLVPYYTKTGTVTAGKVQAQAKVIFNYE